MMGILRKLIAIIFVVPALILSVFTTVIPVLLTRLIRLNKISNWILRIGSKVVSEWIIFFLGTSVEILGKENLPKKGEVACYMANHLSLLDIVVIQAKLNINIGFIGKAELMKVPVINLWFLANKSILLNRKKVRSSINAILKGVKQLKEGWPLVVFPEGTRNKNNTVAPFKGGTMKLALRSGVPIIPICIVNTQYSIEKRSKWKAKKVKLSILPRVVTNNLEKEDKAVLNHKVRDIILKEYNEINESLRD